MKNIYLLILIIILPGPVASQTLGGKLEWQTGMYGYDIGTGGMLNLDINNDGIEEIIATAVSSDYYWDGMGYFYILENNKATGNYNMKWMSRVFSSKIQAINAFDLEGNGNIQILVALSSGEVKIFDVNTLREKSSFKLEIPTPILSMEFDDANNDSSNEIIVTTSESTFFVNKDYKIFQEIPFGGRRVEIGNIDSDPNRELVFSSGKVVEVKDNIIQLEEELFSDNANSSIGLTDVNKDNILDVIYSYEDLLFAYDFNGKSFIWKGKWQSNYNNEYFIKTFSLYDYDGDGVKDIFTGTEGFEGIHCYNGATGAKEFVVGEGQYLGGGKITISNFDSDPNPEIIWAVGEYCSCSDHLMVYDLTTRAKEWQNIHMDGPFQAFDVGDFDNDGKKDIVVASFEGNSRRDGGFLSVFDAETHQLKWQSSKDFFWGAKITFLTIGDVDNDNQNELLIGLNYGYSKSHIRILNSNYQTKAEYSIDGMDFILGIKVADLEGDGKNEIVVTTGTNVSGSTDPEEYENYIYILNGKTGEVKWKSNKISGISSKTHSLIVGNIDEDDALEIAAINSGSGDDIDDLIIIDGVTYEMMVDKNRNYSGLDFADFDGDNINDVVVGTKSGEILIIDGTSKVVKAEFTTGSSSINSLRAIDLYGNQQLDFIFIDDYRLNFLNSTTSEIFWKSDSINSDIGLFNRIQIENIDSDSEDEILLDAQYALYQFEITNDYDPYITGISDPLHRNVSVNLFPNPFSKKINISFNTFGHDNAQVRVLNLAGKEMVTQWVKSYSPKKEGSIDLEILPSGLYIFEISFDKYKVVKKVIKN